jgi:predicted DNA-binding protein with PD1-like motif
MDIRRCGKRDWLVVLRKGERVVASLLDFAAKSGVDGGWVSGLGSVVRAELGFYDLGKRTYHRRKFDEDMELGALQGNFARAGRDRVLHAHAVLAGPEMIALAGHLFEAEVAVVCEFHVRDFLVRLDRADDASVGLKTLVPCPAAAAVPAPGAGGTAAPSAPPRPAHAPRKRGRP